MAHYRTRSGNHEAEQKKINEDDRAGEDNENAPSPIIT